MAPSSEIHIEATETDPAVRAQDTVRSRHRRLRAALAAFTGTEEVPASDASAHPDVAEFCTGELRRYLAAADRTLYAAAAGAAGTRLLVHALRNGAAALDEHIRTLADAAADGPARTAATHAVEAVLAVHLTTEETVLLPALAALPGAQLPTLVSDMEILLDGGSLSDPAVLDVRAIPHGRRHPRIFTRYARLGPGDAFTLVNNHDPKPLRREFEAAHPGTHTWEYLESGPEVWKVRIGKADGDA